MSQPPLSRLNQLRRAEIRMEQAYQKIEQAAANGENVSHWERLWLELLNEYSALYEQEREQAG